MCRGVRRRHFPTSASAMTNMERRTRRRSKVPKEEIRGRIRRCCEIRLRAERKWRQLYDAGEKARGGGDQRSDHRSPSVTGDLRTLAEHGVTKRQAADWGKLASLSDEQFDAAINALSTGRTTRPVISGRRRVWRSRRGTAKQCWRESEGRETLSGVLPVGCRDR
jgi:hypothetical protein